MMHCDTFISQQINGATTTMTLANSHHLKRPIKKDRPIKWMLGQSFFSLNMLVFANDENTLS